MSLKDHQAFFALHSFFYKNQIIFAEARCSCTQIQYYGITCCLMGDFCLGIAWFCFVEVKKFKNHFAFSCFFF